MDRIERAIKLLVLLKKLGVKSAIEALEKQSRAEDLKARSRRTKKEKFKK